ncbi:MAG TPA: MgtC/SapB family protein, partial [Chloroflexi bacterium]|nr:MgtC/SapB family protein [Chloroflexota bacterium]
MEQIDLFYRFGVALAIGFLIGLQREYAHGGAGREIFAGERTLALMGLVGCIAAFVADLLNAPWAFLGIVLAIAALIIVAYFVGAWRRGEVGLTSETAALVTILTGALCYWGYITLALAIGVITIVLLSLKVEMDTFVRRITREDVRATLQFAVITAIVLPLLPNRTF